MPGSAASIPIALFHSLTTLTMGYFPAVVVGLLLGLLISWNPVLCQIGKRLLQLPVAAPVAYVVVFLIVFQSNSLVVMLNVLFSSLWFIAIHTGIGLQPAFQQRRFAPAIPQIFLGLRLGLTMAWSALLLSEVVLSGVQGLGFYIWNAYQNANTKEVFNGVIAVFLVTFISDQLLDALGELLRQAFRPPASPG